MKKISTSVYFAVIAITFVGFFFTDVFCGGSCPSYVFGRFDVVYPSLLGLIPTLGIFLFFKDLKLKIFMSWIRHIAWWFFVVAAWIISNTSDGFILSPGRNKTTLFLVSLFFIITLVYALVMHRKYTMESQK